MVRVRLAEISDIDALVQIGRVFHSASPYNDIEYHEVALAQFLLNSMTSETAGLFVAEHDDEIVGTACVAMAPIYFAKDAYFATEMFWFVHPDHRDKRAGIDLLQQMEAWSAAKGCKYLAVISFNGKAPNKYSEIETTHARRLI